MNILLIAHRPLSGTGARGGERSMRLITEHLAARGHRVRAVPYAGADVAALTRWSDVLLTWGLAAETTHRMSRRYGVPYVLAVRWWRNVVDVRAGIGDLMTRPIDPAYQARKAPLFTDAAAVVTNSCYAARVIRRYYDVEARVSYVPAEPGGLRGSGNPHGNLLLVTPEKGVGEWDLLRRLPRLLPSERFVAINARREPEGLPENVQVLPYQAGMGPLYASAKLVLFPLYGNDCCGTSRVAIEAAQYGTPTLGNDRSGLCERGILPISRKATWQEWAGRIREISADYGRYTEHARQMFTTYDTAAQLAVYERALMEAAQQRIAA